MVSCEGEIATLTFHPVWQVLTSEHIFCEEFGICDLTQISTVAIQAVNIGHVHVFCH